MSSLNPENKEAANAPGWSPPPGPPTSSGHLHRRDLKTKKVTATPPSRHRLSPGAKRVPAHRPCKAICFRLSVCDSRAASTNLRFDDTQPREGEQGDVTPSGRRAALGCDGIVSVTLPTTFDQLFAWAVQLVKGRQGLRR